MPMPGSEEVTKHSVHTLVFRSQKRAHEMFISDQGNLPEADKDMDSLIKRIKAKAYYGAHLVHNAEQEKSRRRAYENRPDAILSDSIQNDGASPSAENAEQNSMMASQSSGNPSSSGGQLVAFTGRFFFSIRHTHYSKSQIFVQKFNSDKTKNPTFSRVFHPYFFWQFFS